MKVQLKNPNDFKIMLIKKGYSQAKLAEAVDLSSPYVSQIVNGEKYPSGKVAVKIANQLNVKFDDIFFISNTSKS